MRWLVRCPTAAATPSRALRRSSAGTTSFVLWTPTCRSRPPTWRVWTFCNNAGSRCARTTHCDQTQRDSAARQRSNHRGRAAHCSRAVPNTLPCLFYLQATTITMQHLRHKLPEVVAAVVQRLVGVGRTAAAADLQEGMNDIAGKYRCVYMFFLELHLVAPAQTRGSGTTGALCSVPPADGRTESKGSSGAGLSRSGQGPHQHPTARSSSLVLLNRSPTQEPKHPATQHGVSLMGHPALSLSVHCCLFTCHRCDSNPVRWWPV